MQENNKLANKKKRITRLIAVQGIYAHDAMSLLPGSGNIDDANSIAEKILAMHQDMLAEENKKKDKVDNSLLRDLLEGVFADIEGLDEIIKPVLKEGWDMARLGGVMRAILRAAVFELKERKKTPVKTVINEYVDIAGSFFDDKETGFINATLQNLAKQLRVDEMGK